MTRIGGSGGWVSAGRLLAMLVVGGLLAACGGGRTGSAPTISNLSYSPHGAYLQSGGGTVTIFGTFDFADPDGDLTNWSLTIFDAGGKQVDSLSNPVQGAGGSTHGTLSMNALVSTSTLDAYSFRIEVTDAQGWRSNVLTATVQVTNHPWLTLPGMPLSRLGFATAMLGGRIYVMGGAQPQATITPAPAIDRVDIFDVVKGSWTLGVPMAVPMQNFVARVVEGKIYAVGEGAGAPGTRTQEFDPATGRWTEQSSPPSRHRDGTAALAEGRIYVLGGDGGGLGVPTMESVDPTTGQWRTDSPMPSARSQLSAVSVDIGAPGSAPKPRIFALGGYSSAQIPDAGFLPSNESYDPVANTWQARAAMPMPAANMATVAFDGAILVFGGDNVARALYTVMQYRPTGDAWTFKTPLPAPATGLQAEVVGRKVYVFSAGAIHLYTPDDDIL